MENSLKDGKPYFVISGEIHYFRLDPKLWEKHLTLLKDSGANTTSTYIPWTGTSMKKINLILRVKLILQRIL